ncbi:MAG: HAMP domain-containing sensor histidine kinase [Myxococcaceae bacterium]|nr:HAMP domain-containing sensor histidine kinase [Myxococcaceae bacterium]
MGVPAVIRPAPPSAREDAFRAFAEALPVGLAWLSRDGELLDANAAAEDTLRLPAIGPALEGAFDEARSKGTCVQTSVEVGGAERVVVTVSPDRSGDGFIASLDRRRLEKARAETGVLRSVIRAMASSSSKREALTRAIAVVREQLPEARVACYELKGQALCCEASGGLLPEEQERAVVLEARADCLVNLAWAQQRQVHVPRLSRTTLTLPFSCDEDTAALVLPMGARTPRGLVCISAPADTLNEGAIRLLQGLVDAISAVTDVAVIEASAARAMEVATQRDRLATIGQLVAGVAHEINNPLAFLKSNLHSLKAEIADWREGPVPLPPSAEEIDEIVTESIEGVSRIETIVQALKGTARRRDEKIRFDCSRAVQEALTIFKGAKKSECEIVAAIPLLPELIGSPSALGQVILNLMQNGLDAMSAVERKRRKLEVRAVSEPGRVRLTVRDHGTGIPLEVQRRMWEAFYTTKEVGKGTGLGLSICKEIAEEMGGWMEFETGPDGTSFHVVLPEAHD